MSGPDHHPGHHHHDNHPVNTGHDDSVNREGYRAQQIEARLGRRRHEEGMGRQAAVQPGKVRLRRERDRRAFGLAMMINLPWPRAGVYDPAGESPFLQHFALLFVAIALIGGCAVFSAKKSAYRNAIGHTGPIAAPGAVIPTQADAPQVVERRLTPASSALSVAPGKMGCGSATTWEVTGGRHRAGHLAA